MRTTMPRPDEDWPMRAPRAGAMSYYRRTAGGAQIGGLTCAPRGLARKDGDSWDIGESVGATALQAAASRAAESAQAHPLICDPFARLLAANVGPAWARLADGDLGWLGHDEHARRMEILARDYHAMRTRFFFSTNAAGSPPVPASGRW